LTVGRRTPDPNELEPIERASVDELRDLQFRRLQAVLKHACSNSGPYRAKCAAAGVSPAELKTLDDLRRFPFTVKDDLRSSYPFGMFAVPQDRVVRIHASSGTTGRPTVVGYTKNDIDTWSSLVARSIRAAGGRRGDKVHVAYGYGLFTGGLGAHYGAERLGLTVIPMSGGQTPKQVQLIQDLKPDIIMCTPSYVLNIADEFEGQGIDPATSSLQIGIFGAEPWGEAMRTEIEKRFGLDALDIYGLSEIMGPGVASECIETKDGPVIWEDHFFPEIIDSTSGLPVADGESGELVITTLTREAMPLIRYRTRDLTRLLPGTARTMRRIEKIKGRNDDMLIIRGVNVFPTQIEEHVLKQRGLSPHYQLWISKQGKLDALTVHVERETGTAIEKSTSIADALKNAIKDHVGVTTAVVVHEPGELPRSAGKAVRVVDERHL
jgi:phenylacetate-CoA ligase